jgi:hypothetical protein
MAWVSDFFGRFSLVVVVMDFPGRIYHFWVFPWQKFLADFLVDVFVTYPRRVVIADFRVDFFVRYSRGVVFAHFLGGWFCRFSWCMLAFSRCFLLIFLVDIFLQIFLMGSFLADFLGRC